VHIFNVLQRGIHLRYIYRIVADFTDRRNFVVSIVTGLQAGRPIKYSSIIGRGKKCCFLINLCTDFVAHIDSPIHLGPRVNLTTYLYLVTRSGMIGFNFQCSIRPHGMYGYKFTCAYVFTLLLYSKHSTFRYKGSLVITV